MAIRPEDHLAHAFAHLAGKSEQQHRAERPELLKALLEGRIAVERASDDQVVLVHADGSREELSPEQTAALAVVLLRAAGENQADRAELAQLHSLVAARNLTFDDVGPTSTIKVAEAKPETETPVQMEPVPTDELPDLPKSDKTSAEFPRPASPSLDTDGAQFSTGFKSGFVGPARGHLDGLPDEDLQFRQGSRRGLVIMDVLDSGTPLASDIGDHRDRGRADQNAFGASFDDMSLRYEAGFVGPGINYLPPLQNEDYRFGDIPIRELDVKAADEGTRDEGQKPVPVPVQLINLNVVEDDPIAGTVFPNGVPSGGIVTNMVVTQQPAVGTVAIDSLGAFTIAVPPNYAGPVTFTYSYLDATGVQRTNTAQVNIQPVADAPAVSAGSSAFSGPEDSTLALTGLSAALVDTDGSETLSRIAIEGVPAGARFVDGTGAPLGLDSGNGVWTFSPGDVERLHLQLAPHDSGLFNLTLSVTSTEQGNGHSATTQVPFTVSVAPLADAPTVSVGVGSFTAPEDQPVLLAGFAASLVDADGSEALSAAVIAGVPAGARFVNGGGGPVGTDNGNGTWSFSPVELADLRFVAPLHVAGTFNMTLNATATEGATSQTASTTLAVQCRFRSGRRFANGLSGFRSVCGRGGHADRADGAGGLAGRC